MNAYKFIDEIINQEEKSVEAYYEKLEICHEIKQAIARDNKRKELILKYTAERNVCDAAKYHKLQALIDVLRECEVEE